MLESLSGALIGRFVIIEKLEKFGLNCVVCDRAPLRPEFTDALDIAKNGL